MQGSGSYSKQTSPDHATKSLKNVLDLERKLEFNDRAVMGGLDRFISHIAPQVGWIRDVAPLKGTNYAALSPGQRQRWASAIMGQLGSANSTQRMTKKSKSKTTSNTRRKPSKTRTNYDLDTPLSNLIFIHKATRSKLTRLGTRNLRDLLRLFPNRHVDYSKVTKIQDAIHGEITTVVGRVIRSEVAKIGPAPGAAKITVNDGTELLEATFFRQAYLTHKIKPGSLITLSGEIGSFNNRLQMQNPEHEQLYDENSHDYQKNDSQLTHAGILLPVYPSTDGLAQRSLRSATRKSLDIGLPILDEFLTQDIKKRNSLMDLSDAYESIHYPKSTEDQVQARKRLAFDELFLYQLAALKKRWEWRDRENGIRIDRDKGHKVVRSFLNSLEFHLTIDQQESLNALIKDMASGAPMGRLLQGEVGSGKTVVALCALLAVSSAGYQGAFMAPTEVLAEQQFLSITNQLNAESVSNEPRDTVRQAILPSSGNQRINIVLLTGSLQTATKSRVHQIIANGEADLIIGTHALLQDQVIIPRLGLVVVDEQHRFGVEQRGALTQQTPRPHLLGMSATPIPRTLSLTIYGDLDITTLKILPEGRQPITTSLATNEVAKNHAYELVRQEIADGKQAFVVCPLIEPSDSIESASALEELKKLQQGEFKNLRVGLLHGRMKLAEKQDVMERVRNKQIDVLVATPVIEVGMDIPNATVMIIMSANRFGLAQLHQLRGRVGRGEDESYCILMANSKDDLASERIEAMVKYSDGFVLAEEDLRIRGPGDFMGTRQSGWDELKIATINDVDLLRTARKEATNLMADKSLDTLNANPKLLSELTRVTSEHITEFS
ncbi:MAG: ATP-dependent DNA helicase RecG [Chloroflexota bacterium]|nr:ATP-dependent DNA helicase RecG [Chloroflexota bacterium]MQG36853.1 ATP-dependent DNA helicase RecG [SAR202 cluster bacterium]